MAEEETNNAPEENGTGGDILDDDGVGFDMVGAISTEREQAKEDAELASFEAMLKNKKKKKKKKKAKKGDSETSNNNDLNESNGIISNKDGNETKDSENDPTYYYNCNDTRDYPYTVLLERIFEQLTAKNPNLITKEEHKLPPPLCARVGSKKTGWSNFNDICQKLHRNHEHVKQFFLTEMNTTGNLDGEKNLILKGRWRPRQVQSLLVKYINDYITCANCRSPNTTLTKDNATRLFILTCNVCNATRSVASIKAGFHAKTRDERRAERNAK